MFTGLVQEIGKVLEKQITGTRGKFKIRTGKAESFRLGDSVAVNGVCLTVTRQGAEWFEADVMPLTLQGTNLKCLNIGDPVNLEPAIRAGDPLGGHLVSGHVDGVGTMVEMRKEQNAVLVKLSLTENLMTYMVVKGSIALDGVSLTIQKVGASFVIVSIIPHTFRETRFKWLKPGDLLNVEADLIIKQAVESRGRSSRSGISLDFLKEHGYCR